MHSDDGPPRYFKYYRVAAIYQVIKSLQSADLSLCLTNLSLSLGALIIYLLNALIYRPAEGKSELALLESACQHLPLHPDGLDARPIMYERGLYFISDIMGNGAYHLPDTRPNDSEVLEALYRRESMTDIRSEITNSGMDNRHAKKRKRKMTAIVNSSSGSEDTEADLAEEGLTGEGNKEDAGQMVEEEGFSSGENAPSVGMDDTISHMLSEILRQFLVDVLDLAPKPKSTSEEPWLTMNAME